MTGRKRMTILSAAAAIGVTGTVLVTLSVGPAAAGARLTSEELAAQADAICTAASEELGPLFGELFPTGSETPPAEDAAPIMTEASVIISAEIVDLTALKPPRELQADWLRLERLLRSVDHHVRRSAQLARQGDTDGYLSELGEGNEVDSESRAIFAEIGATACSG